MKFRIDVPIYKTGVYFLTGESDEAVTAYVQRKTYGHWKDGIPLDEGVRARVLLHESRLSFVRITQDDIAYIPCISHEIMHTVFHILGGVNMTHVFESEEAYTYLLEYLLDQYIKKVKINFVVKN